MSLYELMDLGQSNYSNPIALTAIFLSLSFAYLAAAYLVGRQLTFTQVSILNTLYVFFAGITAYGSSAFSIGGASLILQTGIANPDNFFGPKLWMAKIVGVCFLVAIIVCLKVMWDIRRPDQALDDMRTSGIGRKQPPRRFGLE